MAKATFLLLAQHGKLLVISALSPFSCLTTFFVSDIFFQSKRLHLAPLRPQNIRPLRTKMSSDMNLNKKTSFHSETKMSELELE